MEGFELIKQGAEAKLYKGTYLGNPAIIKERFVKQYRHPDMDTKLTHDRIKAEARIISRCYSLGILTPTLYLADLKRRIIVMQHFHHSVTVKEFIFNNEQDPILKKIMQEIGRTISKMHNNNVIHGDLTTSNMLLVKKNIDEGFVEGNMELALIDFGLSYVEQSAEDKGVDLYVLERAFISTHNKLTDLFPTLLEGYKGAFPKSTPAIIKKFEEVRARGRKRTMVG